MNTFKKYWLLWFIILLLLVWYFWPKGAKAAKKTTEQCESDIAEANKESAAVRQIPLPNPVTVTCPHGEKKVTTVMSSTVEYLKSKGWK